MTNKSHKCGLIAGLIASAALAGCGRQAEYQRPGPLRIAVIDDVILGDSLMPGGPKSKEADYYYKLLKKFFHGPEASGGLYRAVEIIIQRRQFEEKQIQKTIINNQ